MDYTYLALSNTILWPKVLYNGLSFNHSHSNRWLLSVPCPRTLGPGIRTTNPSIVNFQPALRNEPQHTWCIALKFGTYCICLQMMHIGSSRTSADEKRLRVRGHNARTHTWTNTKHILAYIPLLIARTFVGTAQKQE